MIRPNLLTCDPTTCRLWLVSFRVDIEELNWLCFSAHHRAGESMEAGILRVDDALHRRLEDALRSVRQPPAAGRTLSTAEMTRSAASDATPGPRGESGRTVGLPPIVGVIGNLGNGRDRKSGLERVCAFAVKETSKRRKSCH